MTCTCGLREKVEAKIKELEADYKYYQGMDSDKQKEIKEWMDWLKALLNDTKVE